MTYAQTTAASTAPQSTSLVAAVPPPDPSFPASPASPSLVGSALEATADRLLRAAHDLLPYLESGRRLDAPVLRAAMERAFEGPDAAGLWTWPLAHEAVEAATVLFLRRHGPAMMRKTTKATGSNAAMLPLLARLAGLLPTRTRRSEATNAFQQFSTLLDLGWAAVTAAALTPGDIVLEPSAGTGLLGVWAELAGASLVLNELEPVRAAFLQRLFPAIPVTRHDAAQIDDHLDASIRPSVVVMNPPFSVMANVDGRVGDAAFRHIRSALHRLADGGRLVAITGAGLAPDTPAWRDSFARLQDEARVVFSSAIGAGVFAPHGTSIETRLTVFDKVRGDQLRPAHGSLHVGPSHEPVGPAVDVASLMALVERAIPPRPAIIGSVATNHAAAGDTQGHCVDGRPPARKPRSSRSRAMAPARRPRGRCSTTTAARRSCRWRPSAARS
jgi:predicted RNA methylase